MNKDSIRRAIPEYLKDRQQAGRAAPGLYDFWTELGVYDKASVARRAKIKGFLSEHSLSLVANAIADHHKERMVKFMPVLRELEGAGVVIGEFEEAREDGKPSRRLYRLAEVEN